MDALIYAEQAIAEYFDNEMKEPYEMLNVETAQIYFFSDTCFRHTMDAFEESTQSPKGVVGLVLTDQPYASRHEQQRTKSEHALLNYEDVQNFIEIHPRGGYAVLFR